MPQINVDTLSRVARTLVSTQGIRGLSLRTIAQEAGTSLGSLSYRVGDKAAVVGRLIEAEREERHASNALWEARIAALDLADPDVLTAAILSWLDEAAGPRRAVALTGCELLLEAGVDPFGFPGIADLLDDEDRFWATLLSRSYGSRADLFGRVICAYCRDELPFSIALVEDTDYRLLRAATVGRLAQGLAGQPTGLALHFDELVAACGNTTAKNPLPVDLPEGSKKAELAGHIAAIIAEQGAASVTHRSVAARAGIPNSSVAHHYRTREDLLLGGMGALVLAMRRRLDVDPAQTERRPGVAVIRSTHSIALAAARDPALRPFALDMRRRRSENVRNTVGDAIAGPSGLDNAAIQAAVIAMIGAALAAQARGQEAGMTAVAIAMLSGLREGF